MSAVDSLAKALYSALYVDLPEIEVTRRRQDSIKSMERPKEHNVSIVQFEQTWSSTALGFGGIGGQALTNAYTTVVLCYQTNKAAIYFNGGFAYLANIKSEEFQRALKDFDFKGVESKGRYFK